MSTKVDPVEKNVAQSERGSLYRKILTVQKKIDSIPKRGFNAFHKYHYATEADILTVKETLNENDLVVLPTTLKQETGFKPDGKSWASVTLLFRVIDVKTGETVESQFTGYAEDNFDKAIYKATTGANKYFYLKFFGIATEDDPEREDTVPLTGNAYKPQGALRTFTVNKSQALPVKKTPSTSQNQQALAEANKILNLQKQYRLSNEEILKYGEIASIKTLAEEGNTSLLTAAYNRLNEHVRLHNKV
jgi:hypothetical protein